MTMTKEDYAARVPDLAERENAAALFEAAAAAEDAYERHRQESFGVEPPEEQVVAMRELRDEYERRRTDLAMWFEGERQRIVGVTELDRLEKAADAARQDYENAPGDAVVEDDDGERAVRCALSGAPIFESDETVEIFGRHVLACVLLTPEQMAALAAEKHDDEDDEIDSFEDMVTENA